MTTKYIIAGSSATHQFRTYVLSGYVDYKHISNIIKEGLGDIFEISDLNEISELLEQMIGWDDFMEISEEDRNEILKELDLL